MATKKQNGSSTPVTPNFKDVDKEATQRAAAALQGGGAPPLKVPASAKVSVDEKTGSKYSRWVERLTIQQAYRTITKKGLMDVTVIGKIRQSDENDGMKIFGHFYLNLGEDIPEGHETMNDRSNGAIMSLLVATSLMPATGVMRGTLLDKMFPSKGQPGVSSPLNGKAVIANIVQQYSQQKDSKTNKKLVDEDQEPIMGSRDNIESFLPDAAGDDGDEE